MPSMTYEQIVARLRTINDELERLDSKAKESDNGLDERDEKTFGDFVTEFRKLDKERRDIERERALASVQRNKVLEAVKAGNAVDDPTDEERTIEPSGGGSGPGLVRKYKDPWDLSEVRTFSRTPEQISSELRSRAFDAIERMTATTDKRREVMTQIIERFDPVEDNEHERAGVLSRLLLAISHPDYVRAFGKYIKYDGKTDAFTPDEKAAHLRAMSTTTTEGGFLIPFQLDPSVINTADGSFNQVRQIARTVVATGNKWHGVSSAGVTSYWTGEGADSTDGSPTLAQPAIDVHKLTTVVPITIEALQDAQNVAQEVGQMIAFEKDVKESVAFVTGTGSGQPRGIVHRLDATAGSKVWTATSNTFAVGDVYALDSQLPARYRFRASYLAQRGTYNTVRQFDQQGGSALWAQLGADVPPTLLGRPALEAEEMATGTATGADLLVFGDLQNYVIADRIGTTVEFIPHLFSSTNQLPTGTRAWYAYLRVGADSVNHGAFRMLSVTNA